MRRGATPPSERSGGLRDEVLREVSEKGERPNELGATPPSERSGGLRDEVLREVSEKGERPMRHGVRIGVEVVVGLPVSLSGREGPAATAARQFATRLARRLTPGMVRLHDERLTTVTAESSLRERGIRGQARRKVVDQAAAVVLLQAALDGERLTGRAPGEIVRGSI